MDTIESIYPPGTLIAGRYEVVKPLAGGMGVVFLCLDRQEDLPIALKTFKPEYLPNRDARDRFLREGNVWVNLGRHSHIVRAYGIERTGDGREVYILLEWVAQAEGKRDASLRVWLMPGQPLPIEQAMLFALHIARGMKHATTKIHDLVHRDLKPENVLIGRDGNARVTDFGLAKTLVGLDEGIVGTGESEGTFGHFTKPIFKFFRQATGGTKGGADFKPPSTRQIQLTQSGHTPGTPPYMAPEQLEGKPLDARADIYAFGCIVYEMVTGKMAVVGRDRREVEQAHRAGRVGELPRGLPTEVSTLLWRCMALGREERYKSWEEVEGVVTKTYQCVVGKDAPGEVTGENETRAERVAKGGSYNRLGLSYHDMGKFDVAMGYFERVLRVGQAEKERLLEASALNNLGTAYAALGDVRRALGFFEQSLAIDREIRDRRGEGITLHSLGNAYYALGDARRAIGFYEQALAIAQELGERAVEGGALGNLGNAYNGLGEPRGAIKFYKQSIAIMDKIGDVMKSAFLRFNLSGLLVEQGRPAEALRHAEYAAQVFAQVGHTQYAQEAQRLIVQIRGQKK